MTNVYRVRAGDRLSTIAALHGLPVSRIVNANPDKPRMQLAPGVVVFASLAAGEDIVLPGTIAGPYNQPLFLKEPCQPGYIRDSFGACVLLPSGSEEDGRDDYGDSDGGGPDSMYRGAGVGGGGQGGGGQGGSSSGGGKASSPDASEQVPLPPEDLADLPDCPLPGYVRDAFAACRSQKDGRPLTAGVMAMLGRSR